MTNSNTHAAGLISAAAILQREARKHEQAQAELEAEGYDERCDEAHMHAMQAELLRRMSGEILDLLPHASELNITF